MIIFLLHVLEAKEIKIKVDLTKPVYPISQLIFGSNHDLAGVSKNTFRRFGGNRLTGYNWENNASSAGSDWNQSSDNYLTWIMGIESSIEDSAAIVLSRFHEKSIEQKAYSLITLQMAGYVSADKKGTVDESEKAPSSRWKEVKFKKQSPLSDTPDKNDNYVFMDELINFLNNMYGKTDIDNPKSIQGFALDNEPALWTSTHPRIHPDKLTCKELISKSSELSKTVKAFNPKAEIWGPVLYGFNAYYSLQDAPDWNTEKSDYDWFIDYYLAQMKKESDVAKLRLLDVLDVHWYSEAEGDSKITQDMSESSNENIIARLNAPRSLWDSTYIEKSWIGQWFSSYLPLIPKLNQSINKYFPETKLAFTEYNYGAENHISGGLAQVDVLGIFAKYSVYAASLWKLHDSTDYIASAFNLYSDYDGKGSIFGNKYIYSECDDNITASVYCAVDSLKPEYLHIILLNKDLNQEHTYNIQINSTNPFTEHEAWVLNTTSKKIQKSSENISISNNIVNLKLNKLTAMHLVLKSQKNSIYEERIESTDLNIRFDKNSVYAEFNMLNEGKIELRIYDIRGDLINSIIYPAISGINRISLPTLKHGTYLIELEKSGTKGVTRVITI